jgi:hypothetical protein
MQLLDTALSLAKQGVPVFACGTNKRPLTENGFHDASTDPTTIARQFANPAATLIGIPTGEASGIDVLDLDPASQKWFADNMLRFEPTRTHRTRRDGGFHLLYRHTPGLTCSAGQIAEGVDLRSSGGYAVWWPAAGVPLHDDSPIADMPAWLLAEIEAAKSAASVKKSKLDGPPVPQPEIWDDAERDRMLSGIETRLAAAEEGQKHAILRNESVTMGGILYATDMSREEAALKMVEWLPSVADHGLALDTALSGIALGAQHPILLGAAAEFGALPPEPEAAPITAGERAALRALLCASAWETMDIPEPDRLLGDVLTTNSRVFLSGKTGLGKTLLGLGIAYGIASGSGFLQWPSVRAGRVLYIDGEMPAELIKPRAIAESGRLLSKGGLLPPGNLLIFGRDIETEARKLVPGLPAMAPLNTPDGRAFLFALVKALGKPDIIIFDNAMSLLVGDQKDEVTWSGVNDLVQELTGAHIGQLWLDHTGHNTDRQYGSSTKAWKFDASIVITPPKEKTDPKEVAFTLTFDKARRRTPDNWQQFEPQTIGLANDVWTSEATTAAPKAEAGASIKTGTQPYACYEVLLELAQDSGIVSRLEWQRGCLVKGVVPSESSFRASLSRLASAKWVSVDGPDVRTVRSVTTL